MQNAQLVTFGGGGLNRATQLRSDEKRIAELLQHPKARTIALWQGKVLLAGDARPELARLTADNSVFHSATMAPAFMGFTQSEATDPIFAYDLSPWQPAEIPQIDTGIFDTTEIRHPNLPSDHRFADLRHAMAQLSPVDAELAASARALFAWHHAHGFCARCGRASEIFMAGWQRNCPACQARHFPRTDPVVIMLVTHKNSVLLGRSPGWPAGMYSLLAGFIEPGETLESAVHREVQEEAGIQLGHVSYLASQPWPFPASLMLGCRAEAKNTKLTLDLTEIEDALWLSREQLLQVFSGQNPNIQPSRPGSIAHFILQNWLADRLQ